MDDADDDDDRYTPNLPHQIGFLHNRSSSSHRPKIPVRNPSAFSGKHDDDDVEEDDCDSQRLRKSHQSRRIHEEGDDMTPQRGSGGGGEFAQRPAKLGYEFAPRAKRTPPSQPTTASAKPALADWTEVATIALLEAWGERFVELGRKSLRSDEWIHVSQKVAAAAKVRVNDAQCRNRLDTLKKKYKKEKARLAEPGSAPSRWVYFERMDSLLDSTPTSSLPPPPSRKPLACGLDSGEYVFMKSRGFVDHTNGIGEVGDSSESGSENRGGAEEDDDDSDPPPPLSKKARLLAARPQTPDDGEDENNDTFGMLAESIRRFGEIYQRIENNKRQQMIELEKMRMEFQRELEVQRQQIFQSAQAEIARIHKGDHDIDGSVTHGSG